MSSNSNSMYLDFWPIVSKIWKLKFNIIPVLYYIDENHEIEISEEYGIVKKLKPVKGIPIYLQCLWIRYWAFQEFLENVCIISDIDMLPLSQKYFIENLENIGDEKYVHLNPCYESYGTLPSCYHVSKGNLFKKILDLHDNWQDSITHLFSLNLGRDPGGHLRGNTQWFADEKFSSDKIFVYKKNNENDVIFLKRENGQNGYRIDRINWNYVPEKVIQGYYYDSHSIRPYSQYQKEINDLVNLLY